MKLSIVTTLYQSAPYLAEFHERARAAAQPIAGGDFEIVLVHDGSLDDSLERAIRLSETDPHVAVVDLSRNFGKERALMAGLRHARGDLVYIVESDLEEEPEWVGGFAAQLADEGCDVVYGIQRSRKGGWLERVTGQWFYRLLRLLTGANLPENVTTARLMTRRFVDALVRHGETELYLEGLFHLTGFAQRPRVVTKHHHSPTTYTLARKMAVVVNAITAMSGRPFAVLFWAGLTILMAGLAQLLTTAGMRLFVRAAIEPFSVILGSLWLIGGLLLAGVGLLGIYLSKVLLEAKRRPTEIVRRTYGTQNGRTPI